jgi:hypothetical protein
MLSDHDPIRGRTKGNYPHFSMRVSRTDPKALRCRLSIEAAVRFGASRFVVSTISALTGGLMLLQRSRSDYPCRMTRIQSHQRLFMSVLVVMLSKHQTARHSIGCDVSHRGPRAACIIMAEPSSGHDFPPLCSQPGHDLRPRRSPEPAVPD